MIHRRVSLSTRCLFCVVFLSLILCSTPSFGKQIAVPADKPTIQAAINAAADGDKVVVADGTYTGTGNKNIDFGGKAIKVQSVNGPLLCIIDCELDGRGFYFHSGENAEAILHGFTICGGNTEYGGGIYCDNASPTIKHCNVINNSALYDGGGIYCYNSSAALTSCAVRDNSASGSGGGILCDNSNIAITNCVISGNTAGMGRIISGNAAGPVGVGGGILCLSSAPTITNCTINSNSTGSTGGGIECGPGGNPVLTNCIVWGNGTDQIHLNGGTPTVTYSDVQGGYTGTGNINADPLFVPGSDYQLTVSSPCIDVGLTVVDPVKDIDGDARPQGAGYDMGADEYQAQQDSDTDGACDQEESGPDGNDPNYDGNNDGTADCEQDNAISCHTFDGLNYVTIACPAPASISDAAAIANPSPGDAPVDTTFPNGFFTFTINDVNPGGATTVTLYLPLDVDTYYKYGPTPANPVDHWYEFIFDGQTGADINGNIVTLHFVDGQRGDDDLAANGTIVDDGAPALDIAVEEGGGAWQPPDIGLTDRGDGGGCFIDTVSRSLRW